MQNLTYGVVFAGDNDENGSDCTCVVTSRIYDGQSVLMLSHFHWLWATMDSHFAKVHTQSFTFSVLVWIGIESIEPLARG